MESNELAPDDPRHGTTNGYGNLGCRCDACRAAHRVNHQRYMQNVRKQGRILGAHGTDLAYDTGCRCDPCRDAHNTKSREYKRARRRQEASQNTSAESEAMPLRKPPTRPGKNDAG